MKLDGKMPTFSENDRRVAFEKGAIHEAGHAIVAVKLDIGFHCIWLDKYGAGEVVVWDSPINEDEDSIEFTEAETRNFQIFYAAGPAAERLLFPEDDYRQLQASVDIRYHNEIENKIGTNRNDPFETDINAALDHLNENTVRKTANRLVKSKIANGYRDYEWKLEAAQVKEIVENA